MTSPEPPTQPTEPQPRRLTRSTSDKQVAGVAGGLASYFGVDPILFRVGFAVLAFAGGAGAFAYAVLWLFVPDDKGECVVPHGSGNRNTTILTVVLVGLAALVFLPDFHFGFGGGLLALAVLVGVIVLAVQAMAGAEGGRPPSIWRALLIAAAVTVALIAGAGAALAAAFGGGAIAASIVIAVGIGLVAGAFTGGRRWLIVPALAVAAPLAIVTAADLRFEGGVGDREYTPENVSVLRDVYRLGAGELVLDLREVDFPSGRTPVTVDVGAGDVRVIVPQDVCVTTDLRVGAGEVEVFGREDAGFDVDWHESPANRTEAPEVVIDADLDFGALEIDDNLTRGDWDDDERGPFRWRDEGRSDEERNRGCRVPA